MVLVRITYPDGSFIDVPLVSSEWNETTKTAMMQWPNADGQFPVSVELVSGAT